MSEPVTKTVHGWNCTCGKGLPIPVVPIEVLKEDNTKWFEANQKLSTEKEDLKHKLNVALTNGLTYEDLANPDMPIPEGYKTSLQIIEENKALREALEEAKAQRDFYIKECSNSIEEFRYVQGVANEALGKVK